MRRVSHCLSRFPTSRHLHRTYISSRNRLGTYRSLQIFLDVLNDSLPHVLPSTWWDVSPTAQGPVGAEERGSLLLSLDCSGLLYSGLSAASTQVRHAWAILYVVCIFDLFAHANQHMYIVMIDLRARNSVLERYHTCQCGC